MPSFIIRVARELRHNQTSAETQLWKCLRGRRLDGLKFRRQHPRGPYIHDFFCEEARLVIELDGVHHRTDLRSYMHDTARDELLAADGYSVLRFANREVLEDIAAVLVRIRNAINSI